MRKPVRESWEGNWAKQVRLLRNKPFKAAAPEVTISRIRSLLNTLGMYFVETPITRRRGIFSYLLQVVDNIRGKVVFQTLGKGRTDGYARASAYGEMVERIQNLAFYMMLLYPSEPETGNSAHHMPFKYYPDEKMLAENELHLSAKRLFRNESFQEKDFWQGNVIGVPFWDVFGAQPEYLPFRAFQVIVGSNGMCSGNTPDEALIHGICEVFERYVLKQLFLSPCNLPDIPMELFAAHNIYNDLKSLTEDNGYKIHIKDCSLGLHLPVIGLLLTDQHGRYAFHLGADPSPVTALERCFTEMHQGGSILFKEPDAIEDLSGDIRSSEFWSTQLHLNIRSYEGHWPLHILRCRQNFPFKGFDHPVSESDEHDLEYLIDIVKNAGWTLLVRNNSFLGFPAYHVYIPGISEMTNTLENTFVRKYLEFDQHLHVLTNPTDSSVLERELAVKAMKRYAAVAPSRRFLAADYLAYYRQHPFVSLPQDELQTLLLQDISAASPPNPPTCFKCTSCRHIEFCNYPFIYSAWTRMKEAMTSNIRNVNDEIHLF